MKNVAFIVTEQKQFLENPGWLVGSLWGPLPLSFYMLTACTAYDCVETMIITQEER